MRSILRSILAIVIAMSLISPIAAQELRVESKIFVGDGDKPVSDSLTLFHEGRAYDMLSSPPEITMIDLAENRIVLLDPVRKIRTEETTGQLTAFVEQLRVRASRQKDPILKFAALPNFIETDDEDGRVSFRSDHLTYRIRGSRTASAATVRAYREFADWSARLSSRVLHGSPPPLPRLHVNGVLESRGLLPEEVERITSDPNRPKASPTVVRSKHKFESVLYPDDLKRIAEAAKYAKDFEFVQLDQYLRPPQQARR